MQEIPLALLVAVFSAIILSLRAWTAAGRRLRRGQPIVPYEPRRPVPWNGLDLLLIIGAGILLQMGIASAVAMYVDIDPQEFTGRQVIIVSVLGNAALLGLALIWLVFRGARAQDLGLDGRRAGEAVLLGLQAFAAVLAPVYALQYVLTLWWPSEHPLVTELKQNPDTTTLAICFVSAVLVAPIVEEFLFRVLLLSWLESLELRWLEAQAGVTAEAAGSDSGGSVVEDLPHQGPPRSFFGAPAGTLPILGSALLFALLHLGHGPDPLPLFLLAVVLGYLYHRTRRLLPCVLVHLLLNACSMGLLWWQVTRPPS